VERHGGLEAPVREAERGTEQPRPHATRRRDGSRRARGAAGAGERAVAVIAMAPPVHAGLVALRRDASQERLAAGDPLAEDVERRACAMPTQDVEHGPGDRARTVVERQREGSRGPTPVSDRAGHGASEACPIARCGCVRSSDAPRAAVAMSASRPTAGAKSHPATLSHPVVLMAASCSAVSTPSAMIVVPSACPSSTMAATVSSPLGAEISAMNVRSIFSVSTGSSRRREI